jgi:hypothetical protein
MDVKSRFIHCFSEHKRGYHENPSFCILPQHLAIGAVYHSSIHLSHSFAPL